MHKPATDLPPKKQEDGNQNRTSQSGSLPESKPTPDLSKREPKVYSTSFFTGEYLSGAHWTVDGLDVIPAEPPTSTAILVLNRGPHTVRASSDFRSCWVDVNVPVAKNKQDILMKCKSQPGEAQ
jgi:hypothetical protein